MERIALLHYTTLPSVGGIERIIDIQARTLAGMGHEVRLIAGDGRACFGTEFVSVPEMHPSHARVTAASLCGGELPLSNHPLVQILSRDIGAALQGCSQCWIHNALTMYLNPFLSVALASLISEMQDVAWAAWCYDVSITSTFWPADAGAISTRLSLPNTGMTYVTLSEFRRREIATEFSLRVEHILVVEPPVDLETWLGLGEEAVAVAQTLDLLSSRPFIFVPEKTLPHKNLQMAIRMAGELSAMSPHPRVVMSGAWSSHEATLSLATRQSLDALTKTVGASESVAWLSDVLGTVAGYTTIRDLMFLADLVLVTSSEEGFGMPVYEALLLRTPVLCSDIPALRETGGEVAHYFSLDASPGSLARQAMEIVSLATNVERRRALGVSSAYATALSQVINATSKNRASSL